MADTGNTVDCRIVWGRGKERKSEMASVCCDGSLFCTSVDWLAGDNSYRNASGAKRERIHPWKEHQIKSRRYSNTKISRNSKKDWLYPSMVHDSAWYKNNGSDLETVFRGSTTNPLRRSVRQRTQKSWTNDSLTSGVYLHSIDFIGYVWCRTCHSKNTTEHEYKKTYGDIHDDRCFIRTFSKNQKIPRWSICLSHKIILDLFVKILYTNTSSFSIARK